MAGLSRAMEARIVLQRFGLGPKQGGSGRLGSEPKARLLAELDAPEAALITTGELPGAKRAGYLTELADNGAYNLFLKERRARVLKHLEPEIGFLERLVLFWANHFSMSADKNGTVMGMLGHYERAVIRRYVLGSFPAMLKATVRHPTMLAYLDNADSIGPESQIGKSWGVGYNENLAREIMELHTLGTDGGYTEKDVTNLALIITGYSYVRGWEATYGYNHGTRDNVGQYMFRASWHQPGKVKLLGSYYGGGESAGLDALHMLALHPKTAEHLAYKMVKHFITDDPTPAMVTPLAKAYLRSRGNLKAMTLALLDLPEAWSTDFAKMRRPYDFFVAQYRALGNMPSADEEWQMIEPLRALNHMPWQWPTPDGAGDENAYWLDPDGMTIRLDTALLTVDSVEGGGGNRTIDFAGRLYPGALSDATRAALSKLPRRRDGYPALFMSPEFLRR